jgi:hypothetical protein
MRNLMLVTVLLLASCGSDSVAVADYADATRDAVCRWLARCGDVESLATCRKINIVSDTFLGASLLAAIEMGKLDFDSDSAQRCLDARASRSCDVTSESSRVEPEACPAAFVGLLHAGAACADGLVCISGVCDVPSCDEACCTGTCVGETAPAIAKIGESCETALCETASFCDRDTFVCAARKPQGAFCGALEECQFGLDCDQTAECRPAPGPGEACTGRCRDVGTTCSAVSHTCVKVALAGESCNDVACSPFYACDAATRQCVVGPVVGAACRSGQACGDIHAFCDVATGQSTGTCTLPKADGSACQADGHCESHYCDVATGMCAPEPICI